MPWALAKDDKMKDRLNTVLYNLSTNICKGAKLIYSFMPDTSEKILKMFSIDNITLNNLKDYKISDNTKVASEKENLFERLDYEEVKSKMEEISA